jgi:hypothetical protein
MVCPTSSEAAKLVNKFYGIMFKARENIDNELKILSFPTRETTQPSKPNPFLEQPLDDRNHFDQFSDFSFVSMSNGCSE